MKSEAEEILIKGARELGISLNKEKIELFRLYLKELKEWNKRINLTTITEDRDIVIKHFLDSLTPLRFLKPNLHLLDIGSGAGFPGIPLKITMPGLKVTLLDSREKKVFFQHHIISTLGLKGINAIHGRTNKMAEMKEFKGNFDIVISRAIAPLKELLSIGSPFLRQGGFLLPIKSKKGLEEADGFTSSKVRLLAKEIVRLPFSDRVTVLLLYRNLC